jgi:hypothetical protein
MSAAVKDSTALAEGLRQMIAALQEERQALAALDVDAIMATANHKQALCDLLAGGSPELVDAECAGLIGSAKQLNEVNRRVRNLLAANVAARLDALAGTGGTYRGKARSAFSGAALV